MKTYVLKPKTDPENNIGFYPVVVVSDEKFEDWNESYDLEEFILSHDKDIKVEMDSLKAKVAALEAGRKK